MIVPPARNPWKFGTLRAVRAVSFRFLVIVVKSNLLLSYPPDDQGVLKAAVNVPVADEQSLDDPEGLTGCHEP